MITANILSGVINPIATIFGWILAAFYSFSHSYGISIILLTLVTMIVVFPLTRKGTRSMMQMQLLQPELLKMRNKHKVLPGMSAQEKQEVRQKQQEEMMALYRENGVSPTGGCLPMFLQFPIFIVLYDTIRGMTKTQIVHKTLVSTPQYIHKKTALYHALTHSAGKLNSFGLNLADSVRTHQHSWVDVIPYVVVILVAVALQYVSIWQITNRNPAASQANPQMQAAQKFMPLIFVVFYIVLPAGVGIYFIVSSLFRVAQQEYMYKHDPHIVEAVKQLKQRKASDPTPPGPRKGIRQMLREAAGEGASRASLESNPREARASKPGTKGGTRPAATSGSGRPSARSGPPRSGQPSRNGQTGKSRPGGGTATANSSGKGAAAGGRPQGAPSRKPSPGGQRPSRPPGGKVANGSGPRRPDMQGSTPRTRPEGEAPGEPRRKGSTPGMSRNARPRRPDNSGEPRPAPPAVSGGDGRLPSGNGPAGDGSGGRLDSNGRGNKSGGPGREPRWPRRPA
jgi:YidC/Oxa1 family membrane protein insertase